MAPGGADELPKTTSPEKPESSAKLALDEGIEFSGALSVAMVAERIGVSPSTIRTWERRYGLATTHSRNSGAHRRYSPSDVQLLQRMAALIKSGVRASDAAQELTRHFQRTVPAQPTPSNSVSELMQAAHMCNMEQMQTLITQSIRSHGLIPTWNQFIAPTIDAVRATQCACAPGSDSTVFLKTAAFSALRTTASENPQPRRGTCHILIVTDDEHQLPAHICGAELAKDATPVTVVDAENFTLGASLSVNPQDIKGLLVLASSNERSQILEHALRTTSAHIIAVAPDLYGILHHRIQRVRTLTACIDEIRAACTNVEASTNA